MIKIANAPCSWGVLEFEGLGEAAGFAQVLDEMAAAGYEGTELGDWGFMPTDPVALRSDLTRRGLALLGAFVPVRLADASTHDAGVETAVRTARLLAAASDARPVIVLADDNGADPRRAARAGRIERVDSLDDDAWRTFATGAERVAREVREATGLRTVFHPHCAGFVEAPWELDALMARTDPALLGLCFDGGHLAYVQGLSSRRCRRGAAPGLGLFHRRPARHLLRARARRRRFPRPHGRSHAGGLRRLGGGGAGRAARDGQPSGERPAQSRVPRDAGALGGARRARVFRRRRVQT